MSKSVRFVRPQAARLARRLVEPRRFIQVVAGARQVGKTTLVQQATRGLTRPVRYASADEPTLRGAAWIAQQWDAARLAIEGRRGAVLVLDEIQKIPDWAESVKRLWDEDTRARRPLKVVLLGLQDHGASGEARPRRWELRPRRLGDAVRGDALQAVTPSHSLGVPARS